MGQGYGDEDAVNQRVSYHEDDSDTLPTPKQAAEEARQFQKSDQDAKLAQRSPSDEALESGDGSGGMLDVTAAYAQILVPQGPEEQPYFAPIKGRKVQETGRRKPIFLGKLGFDALVSQAKSAMPGESLAAVPGRMALSARAAPHTNSAARNVDNMGTYIVRPGDTLSSISVAIYGTSGRWMELAHVNRLGNGSIIFPKELILYVPDPRMVGQK